MIDYIRFKALRLNTVLDDDWENLQKEANSLAESVKWVNNWRDTLITKLKLPAAWIDQAERSIGEMAYANTLQRHASIDDWFDLHVVMIPCVWVSFTFCTLRDLAHNLGLATARQTSRFRSEDKQMYVLEPYFSTSS